jgi:hypothetical protein
MEIFTAKDKQIFEDMKQCVKDLGLKIVNEDKMVGSLCGMSTFEYPGYNMAIGFLFHPSQKTIDLSIRYADVPMEKIPALYELLNHININMILSHFCIEPNLRMIMLRTGLYVTGYFLNKEEFKRLLNELLGEGHTFYPLIGKLILTDQTSQSIMDEFYAAKDTMPFDFLGPDGKAEESKVTKKHSFIIHGCKDMPAFPTHSHGMTDLGMPEFLIDHFAFGVKQNGGLIGASYEYFIKPENSGKLDSIKNGGIVKLMDKDLKENANPSTIVYCYRRVYPEFEMVKQAYNIDAENNQSDVDPMAWFVQIYVEGDDFALTDEYYKGGIKW